MIRGLDTPHFFQKGGKGFARDKRLPDMPFLPFTGFFYILVDNQFSRVIIFTQSLRNQERRLGESARKMDCDVGVQFLLRAFPVTVFHFLQKILAQKLYGLRGVKTRKADRL